MKNIITGLKTGKFNKMSAIALTLMLFVIMLGCGGEKPSAPPTEAEAQALVKSTLSDFADAIDKGDFTTFKANASQEFQTQFTDDQLKSNFKAFTDNKEVILPILRDAAKKNAKFTPAPAVRDEKGYSLLSTNGTIDSEPQPVKVDNDYVYQGGKWKLLKVGVDLQ